MNSTIISYYYICKRKCWLNFHKINLEDNSEDVLFGKFLHEQKAINSKNSEIKIENVKIDKITEDYVIEYKKANTSLESHKMQVLNYLYILKNKGINKKGKIVFLDNSNDLDIELTNLNEKLLKEKILEIISFLEKPIPEFKNSFYCKNCAYKDYCLI